MAEPTLKDPVERHWVAQLYYYVAALVGLILVVFGSIMFAMGLKQAAFPDLGFQSYACSDYDLDEVGERCTPSQKEEQQDQELDNRREDGVSQAIDGLLVAGIGAPILYWHLRQTRRSSEPAVKN